jgi:hypothetical protein
MNIILKVPGPGILLVIDESGAEQLLSLQDLVGRAVTVEVPKPVTIEADEPPAITGYITLGSANG